MDSYYVKAYVNSDTRNCRNYNTPVNNSSCHYVIFRSNSCDHILESANYELYQNSDYTTRYQSVIKPNSSDLLVTSTNCSTVADSYGGQFTDYSDYLVGAFFAIAVLAFAFITIIGGFLRRHL